MQSSTESNSRNVCNLKTFRSGGRTLVMKQPDLSRPSTSMRPLDKPIITDDVRELEPRVAFNLRLIEMVRHRRLLFDGRTPGGGNPAFRMQMWDGLARQLEYEKGGPDLQKRWKQIRDKYVKERRALLERDPDHPMGQTCTWPLFNKMSFLDPFLVDREPERSVSPMQSSQSSTSMRNHLPPKEMTSFNRRVIAAIRAQPVLYSKADPGYHTPDRRTEAWHAVLSDLNFPCDTNEMQRYWKGLRDRYIRLRRRMFNDHHSSDGSSSSQSHSGKKDVTTWVHYRDLTWLEPFLEMRQRAREECALTRQAADRTRRGLVAMVDEEDGVIVDYEVDREDVEASLLYDEHAELLERGVRFDGDTAYAASVIADIRALPAEMQAHVRARIELALECAPRASEMMDKSAPMDQLQQMIQLHTGKMDVKEEDGMRLVKDEDDERRERDRSREEEVRETNDD